VASALRPLWHAFLTTLLIIIFHQFCNPLICSASPLEQSPAIWLSDTWTIDVSPTRGIILDIERRARVNSPQGRAVGRLKIWETFYQALQEFHGAVTDTLGGVLYVVGKEDLNSGFPFSDYRLYSEDRLYEIDLSAPSFPYLVEYHYRLNIDNTFFWPDWVFPDSFPRRSASYTVAVPRLFGYRTRAVVSDLQVDSNRTLKRDITAWSISDVRPDTLGGNVPVPVMYVAPENFVVARQRGSTESWASLGRWYAELTKGRRKISGKQVREIRDVLRDPADPYSVVSDLKDFVSANWRYVAIEIGIGGWRPHDAESVYDSKYGDCKDLTYLWLAMLDEFGIKAYPALISTRNRPLLILDFPKDWFDHVIGCAIIGTDTIWADLTAPGYRAGTLPYQAEDRHALVIAADSGVLCRTPASFPAQNRSIRSLVGSLDQAGNLQFSLRAEVSGHMLRLFGTETAAENHTRKAAEVLGVFPGRLSVDSMSFDRYPDGQSAEVHLMGTISEWAEFTRYRLVFPLALAGWAAPQPLFEQTDGSAAMQRPYPCHEIDSLMVVLPPGYEKEFIPQDIVIKENPVQFVFASRFVGDTLVYVRDFVYFGPRADAGKAEPRWETIQAIQRADAVFVRPAGRDKTDTTTIDSTAWEF